MTVNAERRKRTVAAPSDQIEHWPLARLTPYERNARKHASAQVEQIAASIREWGWTIPVLVDEAGVILAGHGRVAAASLLHLETVPVLVARGWSSEQKRAYRIADNRLTETSEWDGDLLRLELGELRDTGLELTLTGFADAELNRILSAATASGLATGLDGVLEPPSTPSSQAGDLWQLGDHRLLCGDATSADDVKRVLGQSQPHLMVTDPPYGVKYDPTWRDGHDLGIGKRSKGKVKNDDRVTWAKAWSLFSGDVVYCWHAGVYTSDVQRSLALAGFGARAQIVWVKQHFVISRGDYHWQHEPCWYAVRMGRTGRWNGGRDQTTVWRIDNNNSFGNAAKETTWGHGTQKPIECMRRPIVNNSQMGDAVYDPFVGSGTTLIAAETTGRRALVIDIDPAYVDVVIQRWQQLTGKTAILDSDGRSFAEIAQERRGRMPLVPGHDTAAPAALTV